MNQIANQPSDADWSHVCETINMLYLAVCQIETTMHDANDSVDTLTHSFTQLANHTRDVSDHVNTITTGEEIKAFQTRVNATADEIQLNISKAIEAFQFYDRVCQRIDHVARSLENVTELLADDERLNRLESWRHAQESIKSSYTMEAERIMFEFIMRGGGVKEALKIYRHHFEETKEDKNDSDEIELF